MARLAPTLPTLRRLFALSGNNCAYADCTAELIESDGLYVGEIAHISAASEGGPRYDTSLTDEQRRAYENLILLCHRHHVRVDSDPLPSIDEIRRMKEAHEARAGSVGYVVPDTKLTEILMQQNESWERIRNRNSDAMQQNGLIRPVNVDATFEELSQEVSEGLDYLIRTIDDIGNEFDERDKKNADLAPPAEPMTPEQEVSWKEYWYSHSLTHLLWESRCLGAPNFYTQATISLLQMRVLHLELLEITGRNFGEEEKQLLETLRAELVEIAASCGYVD